MIEKLTTCTVTDLEQISNIWLKTNITAHNFINAAYWYENYEQVKELLPQAELIVYREEEIQGFIGLAEDNIAGLFVATTFQGKGIGKQLLQAAKQQHSLLSLAVYQKNTKAVQFYHSQGFIVISSKLNEATNEMEYIMQWVK